MLSTTTFLAVAMQCAATVHPSTSLDVARVESGYNPYAIAEIVPKPERKPGDKGFITHMPKSKEDAVSITKQIEAKGRRYSVGLMQITSTNFPQFGVSAESMFNPCDNMTVAAKIITDCYQRGGTLQRALSCYYSGNFETGQRPESAFGNTSYVQRIGYVVPSTRAEQQTASPSSGEAPAVPSDNTVYPDSVIRGVIPAPDTTPTSIAAYPPHVVRGGLAVSSD